MEIAFPFVLVLGILLSVAAVVGGWMLWSRRARASGGMPVAHSERLSALPRYVAIVTRRRRAVAAGLAITVLLAVVTSVLAARLVYTSVVQPEKFNRDIVLCLDVSGSMESVDAEIVSRFREMLPGFDGERIALVFWDSSAAQVFPLTDDYDFVAEQLDLAETGMRGENDSGIFYWSGTIRGEGSSLIGDGLASCVLAFGDVDTERSRSLILATDNYSNGPEIMTLQEAAAFAKASAVRIYGLNPAHDDGGTEVDEYQSAVESTDGVYYPLSDTAATKGIVDTIQSDQAALITGAPRLVQHDEPGALGLLALGGVAALLLLLWRARL